MQAEHVIMSLCHSSDAVQQLENISSRIDVQTHASSVFDSCVTLTYITF